MKWVYVLGIVMALICGIVTFFFIGYTFGSFYPTIDQDTGGNNDYGTPLFLTPMIEGDNIANAKLAAKVPPLNGNIESYAGFLTVNKVYNSNMFFWFFPSESDPINDPLVVWLQGGPGVSSMYGLFCENGPLFFEGEKYLGIREIYWSKEFNMIYIDNPVGTGFSFTENDEGYARNEVHVGNDLYSAISQFLDLFPEFRPNNLYVAGESYGGKYAPALAYTIHLNNMNVEEKINLKGIIIGNGFCDPENMMGYGDYLYQLGLLDLSERDEFYLIQNEIVTLVQQQKYDEARNSFDEIFKPKSLFENSTGFHFYYNVLLSEDSMPCNQWEKFITSNNVRKNLHVSNFTYSNGEKVSVFLQYDFMQSVKNRFEILLENYRILVYNGQLDVIVPYPLTTNFLMSLNWLGAEDFKTAKKQFWMVNGRLAGYIKTAGSLTQVLVRNSGHMVPMDQPSWALNLITRFTKNGTF